MLRCRRRATHASSSPTSACFVASRIVSFVIASYACCAAQELIKIDPEHVTQYYPAVTYDDTGKYNLSLNEQPVTVLLRTDPNSEFKMKILGARHAKKTKKLVLSNGWNTDCQLRFDFAEMGDGLRTWTVHEKGGSKQFHQITQMDVYENYTLLRKGNAAYPGLEKADGVQLGWDNIQPVPIQDCVLETETLGDDGDVYNLTFTASGNAGFSVVWDPTNTTFVRLGIPTTTVPSKATTTAITTPEATDPDKTTSPSAEPTTTDTIAMTTTVIPNSSLSLG